MNLKLVFLILISLFGVSIYTSSSLLLLTVVLAKIILILLFFMELKNCHQAMMMGIFLFFVVGTSLVILL
ncbi:MAG: hypothetical protein IPK04_20720 [Bdellovibrionales bacterium]|nr:hypothetical protein [Bdellovibrionales bacterium]